MTLSDTRLIAAKNLIDTYFTLATATEGTTVWQEDGFKVCLGDFEHPICNFAADLKLDNVSKERLAAIAKGQSAFNVYALASDRPSNSHQILEDLGFRLGHHLVQMGSPRIIRPCSIVLTEATNREDRHDVARFMVDQFFSRQSAPFRRRVVETTTAAEELPLFYVKERNRLVGAAMVSLDGDSLGIYNLCVATWKRGSGLGTEILQALMNLPMASGRHIVLQCERNLKEWYCRRGFEPDGNVGIYNLPKRIGLAIMESNGPCE